ncbi:Transposase [Ruegeria denitrificans]|uniref:Transposase n=1 Tax=Ruegeria denitrificans TaxID=1715692 RepID=A0A0P1I0M4_9RHOB|nr:Transposase [Ruegeria denitrificans]
MRKSRFTDTQIIGMIKEQEAGMPTAEVCRKHGLSQGTFYKDDTIGIQLRSSPLSLWLQRSTSGYETQLSLTLR